jgi:hypothetical protein
MMLPSQVILKHFSFIDSDLLDIVFEIRNLVVDVTPYATEHVQRKGLTYFDAKRGGHVSAGICQILILKDHIRLAFIHGAFLPDPHRLLIQEGERKAKRFIPLDCYNSVPWEQVKELIKASADFDPYSLANQ